MALSDIPVVATLPSDGDDDDPTRNTTPATTRRP